jgi:hypothetical protein
MDRVEGDVAVGSPTDLVALFTQHVGEQAQVGQGVVDDEDRWLPGFRTRS